MICWQKYEQFFSINGCLYYGLSIPSDKMVLEQIEMDVPVHYNGIVPVMYRETLGWRIQKD